MSDIVTCYSPSPLPDRQFDWTATRGDYDLDKKIGWGRTEAEAVADLIDLEEGDAE